jgi:hypothetical protein
MLFSAFATIVRAQLRILLVNSGFDQGAGVYQNITSGLPVIRTELIRYTRRLPVSYEFPLSFVAGR